MKYLALILIITTILFMAWQTGGETNGFSTDLEVDSSQYWSVADNASLSITGDITITTWMKIESFPTAGNINHFVSKGAGLGTQKSYMFGIRNPSACIDGSSYCLVMIIHNSCTADNDFIHITPSVHFVADRWYHVAATWKASNATMTGYVDGESIGTAAGLNTSIADCTSDFAVGANSNDGTSNWDGKLDDVRVYNRLLTGDEIKRIYREGDYCRKDEPGLVGCWRFNNNGNDTSDSGNNLTNNNSTTFSEDVDFRARFIQMIQ